MDGHKVTQKAVEKSFLGTSWLYHKEIANKLKVALEDEIKTKELILELERRGYSKAADTLKSLQFSLWITGRLPILTIEGLELLTDWRGSTRS